MDGRRRGAKGHNQRPAPPRGADRAGASGGASAGDAAEVERVGTLCYKGGLAAAGATGVAEADAAARDVAAARGRHS
jgi:hypothetical protein